MPGQPKKWAAIATDAVQRLRQAFATADAAVPRNTAATLDRQLDAGTLRSDVALLPVAENDETGHWRRLRQMLALALGEMEWLANRRRERAGLPALEVADAQPATAPDAPGENQVATEPAVDWVLLRAKIEKLQALKPIEPAPAMVEGSIEPASVPSPDDDLLPPPQGGRLSELAADVRWAYANLCYKVAAADAPSPGAWGLLRWARKNQSKFFDMVSDLPPEKLDASTEHRKRYADDTGEHLALLDRFEKSLPKHLRSDAAEEAIDAASWISEEDLRSTVLSCPSCGDRLAFDWPPRLVKASPAKTA